MTYFRVSAPRLLLIDYQLSSVSALIRIADRKPNGSRISCSKAIAFAIIQTKTTGIAFTKNFSGTHNWCGQPGKQVLTSNR